MKRRRLCNCCPPLVNLLENSLSPISDCSKKKSKVEVKTFLLPPRPPSTFEVSALPKTQTHIIKIVRNSFENSSGPSTSKGKYVPMIIKTRRIPNTTSAFSKKQSGTAGSSSSMLLSFPQNNNPFTIDLIIENLMQYFGVEDLKSCRLVSKKFSIHASAQLNLIHPPISLTLSRKCFQFSQLIKGGSEKFSSLKAPYSKILLGTKYSPRIENYLKCLSPFLTSLQIAVKTSKGSMDLKQVMFCISHLPNLRFLELQHLVIPPERPPWKKIVLPQLKSLKLDGWIESSLTGILFKITPHVEEYLIALFDMMPKLENIQTEFVRISIPAEFLKLLNGLENLQKIDFYDISETVLLPLHSLHLKSLRIEEIRLKGGGRGLSEYLKSQSDSLEELIISINTIGTPITLTLHPMTKLRRLSLGTVNELLHFYISCPGEEIWPQLGFLSISEMIYERLREAQFYSCSVVEVELSMATHCIDGTPRMVQDDDHILTSPFYDKGHVDILKSLKIAFPNFTRLHIYELRLSALKYLFTKMCFLEFLEIGYVMNRISNKLGAGAVLMNQILTGVPNPIWMAQNMTEFFRELELEGNRDGMETMRNFLRFISPTSITSMKNLKELVLYGKLWLDDSAVQLALSIMHPLEKLVFIGTCTSFAPETIQVLKEHHKIVLFQKYKEPRRFIKY